jgi:endo-1,3-1,4-beta-glycanase ExoK
VSCYYILPLGLCVAIGAAFCACSHHEGPSTPGNSSGDMANSGGTATGAGGSAPIAQGGTSRGTEGVSHGGAPKSTGGAIQGGSSSSAGGASYGGTNSGGTTTTQTTGGQLTSNGGFSAGGDLAKSTGGISSNGGALGGTTSSGGYSPRGGASSNGGSGTGGNQNTGGTPAGGTGSSSAFVLAWQDEFNTLDTSLWQLQNFTYDGNQATFVPDNAKVTNGTFTISLTNAASGATKPYLGVEARSSKTITYGKVSARMRFAKGSGVVSGLVLFYTPYPNCDWNEIDIEHLGKSTTSSQLNAMVYTGTYNANCTASVSPTQEPLVVSLGFDAEADFHLYDIEWTPAGVKYYADGALLRDWTSNISLLKRPMNILLTIWASSSASWAGALTSSSAPTTAEIDWIRVYDWKG